MSLSLNETFRVAATPERVWQFLKNPAEVVTCLPGAELTSTIDERTYGGRVKVKVGPITAAYSGKATLTEVDDAARRMQIVGEGKESGGSGSARMTMTGVVSALPDGASEVSVDAVIDIAGRVMQFGRGLIESVNKQLFKQFAESVQARLATADGPDAGSIAPGGTPGAESSHDASTAARDTAQVQPATTSPDAAEPPAGARGSAGAAATAGAATNVPPLAAAPSPAGPVGAGATIAQGEELRAIPLLWKVLVAWIKGWFGRR